MSITFRNREAHRELDRLNQCDEGSCTTTNCEPCGDPACRGKQYCADHRLTCSGCGLSFCDEHASGWVINAECGDCKIDRLVPQQELLLEVA